jgi:hypothetical protein
VAPLLFALVAFVAGCNQAPFRPLQNYDAACPVQLEYPCTAGPPAEQGCVPDPSSGAKLEKQVPLDASYPYGCTVILPDPTPDETGQCAIRGTCRCDLVDGGLAFACRP